MNAICAVSVGPLVALLDSVEWPRSGTSPWDGTFGMVPWSHMSPAVRLAVQEITLPLLDRYLKGCVRGTTFLARLVPGQRVPPHTDREDDSCASRVHVPLLTNSHAVFLIEHARHHMEVGHAYLIDPTCLHAAHNGGTTDRVHLLFNAVAPQRRAA